MKKKIIVTLGICMLTLTGCGKSIPKLDNGQEVVASIDGLNITANDIYEDLKKSGGTGVVVSKIDEFISNKELSDDDNKEAEDYANKIIDSTKEQASLYGVSFEDFLKQYGYASEQECKDDLIVDYKKGLALQKYLAENLTDEEINKYYNEEVFGELTVKHILITPDTKDDATDDEKKAFEEEAKQKAKDLIEQIKNGADFEKLAKENSADGSASQGGLISGIKKDNTDESFFNAALNLKDGEYTLEPVKSQFGYHVILRVSQNEKPTLESILDDVKEKVVTKKLSADTNNSLQVTAWDELRKKYNVKFNDTDIEKNYNDTINSYKK